jgi:hypothetical protein
VTATTRKQFLLSCGIAASVMVVLCAVWARDMRRVSQGLGRFVSLAALGVASQAQEDFELPRACEVVVEQELDGGISVSGRALPHQVVLDSRDELRRLLRSLPRRGAAIARVKEPAKPREIRLGPPGSPAARQAQAEVTQLLIEEGFAIARVPGPKLLPLPGPLKEGRPARVPHRPWWRLW